MTTTRKMTKADYHAELSSTYGKLVAAQRELVEVRAKLDATRRELHERAEAHDCAERAADNLGRVADSSLQRAIRAEDALAGARR